MNFKLIIKLSLWRFSAIQMVYLPRNFRGFSSSRWLSADGTSKVLCYCGVQAAHVSTFHCVDSLTISEEQEHWYSSHPISIGYYLQ